MSVHGVSTWRLHFVEVHFLEQNADNHASLNLYEREPSCGAIYTFLKNEDAAMKQETLGEVSWVQQ